MKMVTIVPVDKKPEALTDKEWEAVKKTKELQVNYITAMENIRLSKGAYRIKPDATPVEVVGGNTFDIDAMDPAQLKLIVLRSGKKIHKKNMKLSDLRGLARRCIEESIQIVDEDEEIDMTPDTPINPAPPKTAAQPVNPMPGVNAK